MYSTVAGLGSGNTLSGTLPVAPEKQQVESSKQRVESPKPETRSRASDESKTASQAFVAHGSRKQTTPEQAVAFANTAAEIFNTKLSFDYDERIDQVVIKVKEEGSEEVIRQIPPEEMVELAAKFKNDFRGLILNHQG
jgi:flagellar protein FlaG